MKKKVIMVNLKMLKEIKNKYPKGGIFE